MKLLIVLAVLFCAARGDLSDLSNVAIPDIDDIAVIREKCDERGGNGTYETLKASKVNIQTCLENFVDIDTVKGEVEEAKKTGSMDEVFGKYCKKRPQVEVCVHNFTDTLKPCLNDEEKKALNVTLSILSQLGEFVCYRDGDRIAMFVAEGGVECIKNHTDGIRDCVNKTLKIESDFSANSLPTLLIDTKKCKELGNLQNCVVEELEKCKDSTPANIVDALFKFVKRSACKNTKRDIHLIRRRSADDLSKLMYFKNMEAIVKFKDLFEKNVK